MNRLTLTAAGLASVAVAGASTAGVVNFDIQGDYFGGTNSYVSNTIDGGGALILSYGYSVSQTVYWNEGSNYDNYFNECRIGIGTFAASSSPGYAYMGQLNGASGGVASPGGSATMSGLTGGAYIASGGYTASSVFGFMAYNTWSDGTGMAAGTISGTGWVNFADVPAPGALALLGIAGLAGRRRRR